MKRVSVSRITLWAALTAAAFIAVYSGAWLYGATLLQRETERWFDARRQEGFIVAYAAPVRSGFPGRVEITVPNLGLTVPDGGWNWQTERVRFFARPWDFGTVFVDLSADHNLTGAWSPHAAPLLVRAAHTQLTLSLARDGRVTDAQMESAGLSATWAGAAEPVLILEKGAAGLVVHSAGETDVNASSRLILSADNLQLPAGVRPPLTRTVRNLRATIDFQGPVNAGLLPSVLESWRAAGGDIEVRDFALDWPPVHMEITGTAALDENLQPMGAFTTKLRGFSAIIDALVADGSMETRDANVARGVLALLARAPAGGGEPELAISLTAQGQKLHAGPITLMDIPKVTWREDVRIP